MVPDDSGSLDGQRLDPDAPADLQKNDITEKRRATPREMSGSSRGNDVVGWVA